MAEQQKLREEAERLQQEKEAQEKARAEQEENERLQKQASHLISVNQAAEASKFGTCFCSKNGLMFAVAQITDLCCVQSKWK